MFILWIAYVIAYQRFQLMEKQDAERMEESERTVWRSTRVGVDTETRRDCYV